MFTFEVFLVYRRNAGESRTLISVCTEKEGANAILNGLLKGVGFVIPRKALSESANMKNNGEWEKVYILDDEFGSKPISLNINLETDRKQKRLAALAKLTEEEIQILRELGID